MLLQSFPNLGSILRFIVILVDEAAGWDCHWGLTLTCSHLPFTWTAPKGTEKCSVPGQGSAGRHFCTVVSADHVCTAQEEQSHGALA